MLPFGSGVAQHTGGKLVEKRVSDCEAQRFAPSLAENSLPRSFLFGHFDGEGSIYGRLSLKRMLRFPFSFLSLLVFLLVTLLFVSARGNIADPDIWWHLRNAEYLMKLHQFPRHDLYSFTVTGHPWVNSEWLSEIPFYLSWRFGGLEGVHALMLFLILMIFLGLLYLCYKESRNFKASFAACCLATLLARVSFGPRTILFGYAYLVLLLIILQRFRQNGDGPLWLIPPLFCLWANTHGSWLLGFIVFSIVGVGGLIQRSWGRIPSETWNPLQRNKIVLTALASAAAVFINPFGAHLAFYPFDLAFRQKLNISHVAEWVSVDFHDARGKVVFLVLFILLLGALLRQNRWSFSDVVLVVFALYSGLTYVRFLFLLGIIVAPLISKFLDFAPPYCPSRDKPLLNASIIVLVITGIAWYWPNSAELQSSVNREYPSEALRFLNRNPPQGRMLNFYLWGGYLGWNDRNLKIFVDSRVDIFEYEGVLKDYLDLVSLNHPESILAKYHIRYVLFPRGEPLTRALERDSNWKIIVSNDLSVLLERLGEAPQLQDQNLYIEGDKLLGKAMR